MTKRQIAEHSKPFTEADVQQVYDELRLQVQKLVDRFGQAQTAEILRALEDVACPNAGKQGMPKYRCIAERGPLVS
jgi:hypothetical protein